MKRKLRLTESDLINLIGKIIEEQSHHEDVFEEYMLTIQDIANDFNREMSEEEFDYLMTEMERLLDSAAKEEELTDEQFEELHDYASDIARELEIEFANNRDLQEGTKAKKPRPMKSKRSGVKTQKIIDQNHEVLKKLVKEDLGSDSFDDPEEFTVTGKIKTVPNPPSKTPIFILMSKNKHLHGTRLIGGLYGYEDKTLKLTGRTENGKHPNHLNPLIITKRPQEL